MGDLLCVNSVDLTYEAMYVDSSDMMNVRSLTAFVIAIRS